MAKQKGLYKLTQGDYDIFAAAKRENDLNRFTNYYMRNDDTGTYWRMVSQSQLNELSMPESISRALEWQKGYESLYAIWEYFDKPIYFGPHPLDPDDWRTYREDEFAVAAENLTRIYKVIWEDEDHPEFPVFHHPHGALLLPWQSEMNRRRESLLVVPGGMGSGKTWAKMLGMLYSASTLKGYRGLALAPFAAQAEEVHKQALALLEGTVFAERFLIAAPTKPHHRLIIGNDLVGRNSIECYSILDGSAKLLTLTADEALVDQAEQIDGTAGQDLEIVIRNVSSRFRGQVRGRPRKGQITLVANSADNPQLYDLYDEAETDPQNTWAYSPTTFENTYLTVADLIRYEKRVGKDADSRRMYLKGERPIGSGEHFPAAAITKCRSQMLDDMMDAALETKTQGWVRKSQPKVLVHNWEMPPEDGEQYIVAADAGWGNPPYRNAACIGVFKITNFPSVPASMVAFDWVFGNNSPNPWMAKYTEYVMNYRAMGMNGFDATGFQSGYERMTDIGVLMPTPVILTGQKKYAYLNITKKFFADGKFQLPASITHAFTQLAKYRLPDDKLRQDIVMMLLVASALLEPMLYVSTVEAVEDDYDPDDRGWRPDYDRDGAMMER